jgi:hypothetical protein
MAALASSRRVNDPQAESWGGLTWSRWRELDDAAKSGVIPAEGGLYRFRCVGEPGLLYIGEGTNRYRRLTTLIRARRKPAAFYLEFPAGTKRPHRGHYAAPYIRQCEDAGCHVQVSCAVEVHADQNERRRVETNLINLHRAEMGTDPPCQFGGRGLQDHLAWKAMNHARA